MIYRSKIYFALFLFFVLIYPLAYTGYASAEQKSFVLFERKMLDATSCQKQLKNFLKTSSRALNVGVVKISKQSDTHNKRLFRIYPKENEVMHFSCDNNLLKIWYDFD